MTIILFSEISKRVVLWLVCFYGHHCSEIHTRLTVAKYRVTIRTHNTANPSTEHLIHHCTRLDLADLTGVQAHVVIYSDKSLCIR